MPVHKNHGKMPKGKHMMGGMPMKDSDMMKTAKGGTVKKGKKK